jgi:hypothetical protein
MSEFKDISAASANDAAVASFLAKNSDGESEVKAEKSLITDITPNDSLTNTTATTDTAPPADGFLALSPPDVLGDSGSRELLQKWGVHDGNLRVSAYRFNSAGTLFVCACVCVECMCIQGVSAQ